MTRTPPHSPVRICFVCSGNICRSPMGEVVLRELARRDDLEHLLEVDSAGTGDWHVGEGAHRRSVQVLAARGYDGSAHRARQFEPGWLAERELVLALDGGHLRTLRGWARDAGQRQRVQLLRAFDPAVAPGTPADRLDVADPYDDPIEAYHSVLDQVEAACRGLWQRIRAGEPLLPHGVSSR